MKWGQVLLSAALVLCACREAPRPTAPSPSTDNVPEAFQALGTEPFWSVAVAGKRLTYSTPDDPQGEPIAVLRTVTPAGAHFAGTIGDAPLSLDVAPGKCGDGMSDKIYPYTAQLRIGAELHRGCARPISAGEETPR